MYILIGLMLTVFILAVGVGHLIDRLLFTCVVSKALKRNNARSAEIHTITKEKHKTPTIFIVLIPLYLLIYPVGYSENLSLFYLDTNAMALQIAEKGYINGHTVWYVGAYLSVIYLFVACHYIGVCILFALQRKETKNSRIKE